MIEEDVGMNEVVEKKKNVEDGVIVLNGHKMSTETFVSLTDNQRERMVNGKQKKHVDWSR